MKKGTITITIGLLLIAAALCLTGYNLWDGFRAGRAADTVLSELEPSIDPDPIPITGRILADYSPEEVEYPYYVVNPMMEMPGKVIDGNRYIGVLSIPALEKKFPVFDEWSYPNLKIAPCRYSGTAYLDNFVICAHNYNVHFGALKDLRLGDTVIFTDMDGNRFTYEVGEVENLQPTAIEEMTAGEWDLTLFTCTIGGQSRVTVRCEKIKAEP